jgi:hypothetical protein
LIFEKIRRGRPNQNPSKKLPTPVSPQIKDLSEMVYFFVDGCIKAIPRSS